MKKLSFFPIYLVGITCIASIYGAEFGQSLKSRLISNPAHVLREVNTLQDSFFEKQIKLEEGRLGNDFESKCMQLARRYERKNPLFLLQECTTVTEELSGDETRCNVDRCFIPSIRNTFEDKVVSALLERFKTQSKPVHYIGFCSGGMFQDLVIATKTLSQVPANARLVMHLIDLDYGSYTVCRDLIKEQGPSTFGDEIKTTDVVNVRLVMGQLLRGVSEHFIREHGIEAAVKGFMHDCLIGDIRAKQFVSYLQKTFPHLHVSLYLYQNVDEFLEYQKAFELPNADAIVAADVDAEAINEGALCEYIKLCKHNPEAAHFLLKHAEEGRVLLISSSDQKNNSSQKMTVQTEDGSIELPCTIEAFH